MVFPTFSRLVEAVSTLSVREQHRAWARAEDWALELWLNHDGEGWEPAQHLYVQCNAASTAAFFVYTTSLLEHR